MNSSHRWGVLMYSSKDTQYQLKFNGKIILFDNRKFKLLKYIDEFNSILKASKKANIPYRTALKYIENMENELNTVIVSTQRGGKGGGGESELTSEGKIILKEYKKVNGILKMHDDINEIESTVSDVDMENKIVNIDLNGKKVILPLRGNFNVGDKVLVLISPEDIFVSSKPQKSRVRNVFEGTITSMELKDNFIRLKVDLGEIDLFVDINQHSKDLNNLNPGKKVFIGFKGAAITMIKI